MRGRKKNVFVGLLALFVMLLAAQVAEARQGRGGPNYDAVQNGSGPWNGPDWSTEQTEKAKKLFADHYALIDPLEAKIDLLKAQRYAESLTSEPDSKKIEQLSQEIGNIQGKIYSAQLELHKKMRAEGLATGRSCRGWHEGCPGGPYHEGKRFGKGRDFHRGYHDRGYHDRGYRQHFMHD